MRIGLDADGCFYNFRDSTFRYFTNHCGYDAEALSTVGEDWNFSEVDWKIPNGTFYKLVARGINAGHIFADGEPEEGFVDAIKWLKRKKHTIHICTNRNIGQKDAANTVEWLKRHKVKYDTLTFAADKTILDVDAFLEDKPKNFHALKEAGRDAWLFDQPYNRDIDTPNRVTSWDEFAKRVHESSLQVMHV